MAILFLDSICLNAYIPEVAKATDFIYRAFPEKVRPNARYPLQIGRFLLIPQKALLLCIILLH